jgi:hypothetical protein
VPHKAHKALQSTARDGDTALCLGEAEDGGLASDAHVEVDNELTTSAEGDTVDGTDDRLADAVSE